MLKGGFISAWDSGSDTLWQQTETGLAAQCHPLPNSLNNSEIQITSLKISRRSSPNIFLELGLNLSISPCLSIPPQALKLIRKIAQFYWNVKFLFYFWKLRPQRGNDRSNSLCGAASSIFAVWDFSHFLPLAFLIAPGAASVIPAISKCNFQCSVYTTCATFICNRTLQSR